MQIYPIQQIPDLHYEFFKLHESFYRVRSILWQIDDALLNA